MQLKIQKYLHNKWKYKIHANCHTIQLMAGLLAGLLAILGNYFQCIYNKNNNNKNNNTKKNNNNNNDNNNYYLTIITTKLHVNL